MRALAVFVFVSSAACGNPGVQDVTTGLGGDLPANGKIFLRGPPLDITFARIDRGETEILTHRTVGTQWPHDELTYIIEPGDVLPGETITMQNICETCTLTHDITFGLTDDVTPPELEPGPLSLSAFGSRAQPYDVLIADYSVQLRAQPAIEESPLLIRFTGDSVDALVQTSSFDASEGVDAGFAIEGGIERTICLTITLMDAAGNETQLPDEECVHLDPSTARGFGELPPPIG